MKSKSLEELLRKYPNLTHLRYMRLLMHLSTTDLGARSRVDPTLINRIENCNRKASQVVQKRLANYFHTQPECLFDEDGWCKTVTRKRKKYNERKN